MKKKLLMLVLVVIMLNSFVSKPSVVYAQSTVSNPVRVWDENGLVGQDYIVTWDCIYFGNYPQSDSTGATKEKIKWQVLSVDDNGVALLLANQNLDVYPYNESVEETTWETSDVRAWLNEEFFNTAFSAAEQDAIKQNNEYYDNVFLLSDKEVCNGRYGFNVYSSSSDTRLKTNTAYVAAGGSIQSEGMNGVGEYNAWWVRSLGLNACVDVDGTVKYGESMNYTGNAICPAIYVDLTDTSLWEKTESVSKKGVLGYSEWNKNNSGKIYYSFDLDLNCQVWGSPNDAIGHVVIPEKIDICGNEYVVSGINEYSGFKNCCDMSSIWISSNITSISEDAFSGCDDELVICGEAGSYAETFAKEHGYKFVTDDTNYFPQMVKKYGVTYLLYPSKKEAYVKGYDFETSYSDIYIPETIEDPSEGVDYEVTKIFSFGFLGAGSIESIYISDTVSSISSGAFALCTNLREVRLPEGITKIARSTFDKCSALAEISIPNSVTFIDSNAFNDCDSLNSIVIPENVDTINPVAFNSCDNLDEVYIYNPEVFIGSSAIGRPQTIYGYKNSTAEYYAKGNGLTFKALDSSHTFSAEYTIDTPATCAKSGSKSRHCTDEGCTEKTDVTAIPATGNHTYDTGVMKTLPTCVAAGEKIYTCTGCGQTKTEAVLATGTHTYGEWTETKAATGDVAGEKARTCSVCAHQETETIPAMGYVKGAEFSKGKNTYTIKSVKGKKGTVIYEGTEKTSKKVSVPKTVKVDGKTYTVTEIAEDAFKDNTKITSVTIPEGVTKIGKNAFSGCKKLKTITIKSTKLKTVGKNAIKGIDKNATIKVPSKQLSKYQNLFKSSTGFKKTMKIKK